MKTEGKDYENVDRWTTIQFSTKTQFRQVLMNEGVCDYGSCPVAGFSIGDTEHSEFYFSQQETKK